MDEKKIGFDTGFFIKVLQNNKTSLKTWKQIRNKTVHGYICALSNFELRKLFLKGAIDKTSFNILIDEIYTMCEIIWIMEEGVLEMAAKISHGSNIPAIDALILSSFINAGITTIYTTDSHFKNYKKKKMSIILL